MNATNLPLRRPALAAACCLLALAGPAAAAGKDGPAAVEVINPPERPVPVVNVLEDGRVPFRLASEVAFLQGITSARSIDYAVPAGQRLHLSGAMISLRMNAPLREHVTELRICNAQGQFCSSYPLALLPQYATDEVIGYAATVPLSVHAEPGERVIVWHFATAGAFGPVSTRAALSGELRPAGD